MIISRKLEPHEEDEAKFFALWYAHFGDIPPGHAKCEDCNEYKNRKCEGGKDPIKCISSKKNQGQIISALKIIYKY